MARQWSEDEVFLEILDLWAEDQDLDRDSIQVKHPELLRAAERYFTSWQDALDYAGLEYDGTLREWVLRPEGSNEAEPGAAPLVLKRASSAQYVDLNGDTLIGRGGEASVYALPGESALVAKVYNQPTEEHARKLEVMLDNPPAGLMPPGGHAAVAWPVDILQTAGPAGQVVGFLMPRVTAMRPIIDFYNPRTRREQCPLFHYQYLIHTGRNLAIAMAAIHAAGYVIGDVNESNVRVSETALVTLVDADSFQVTDPDCSTVYRCPVGKPEFTPPELQGQSFAAIDRTPEHDRFGLAVLLFQLLMEGAHPFAGVYTREGEPPPLAARIADGQYPDSAGRRVVELGTVEQYLARVAVGLYPDSAGQRMPYRPMPAALPLETLHPPLRALFRRCFEDGHHDPGARPDAREWATALAEAEAALIICATNDQHRYGGHLASCPWCVRAAQLGGRDPFPSRRAVERGLRLPTHSPTPRRPSPVGGAPAGHAAAGGPAPPAPASPAASPQPAQRAWLPAISDLFAGFGCILGVVAGAIWMPIYWANTGQLGPDKGSIPEGIVLGAFLGLIVGGYLGKSLPYVAIAGLPAISGWGYGAGIGLVCGLSDASVYNWTAPVGAVAGLACGALLCVQFTWPGWLSGRTAILRQTRGVMPWH